MPDKREMTVEQQAKELVDTALKDHNDGGYQFASVGETIALRIAQAIREAVSAEREACARFVEAHAYRGDQHNLCLIMAEEIRARGEK